MDGPLSQFRSCSYRQFPVSRDHRRHRLWRRQDNPPSDGRASGVPVNPPAVVRVAAVRLILFLQLEQPPQEKRCPNKSGGRDSRRRESGLHVQSAEKSPRNPRLFLGNHLSKLPHADWQAEDLDRQSSLHMAFYPDLRRQGLDKHSTTFFTSTLSVLHAKKPIIILTILIPMLNRGFG